MWHYCVTLWQFRGVCSWMRVVKDRWKEVAVCQGFRGPSASRPKMASVRLDSTHLSYELPLYSYCLPELWLWDGKIAIMASFVNMVSLYKSIRGASRCPLLILR
jgi:hypothetical protein